MQGDNEILMDVNIYITAYDYEASPQLLGPGYRASDRSIGMKRQIRRELSEWGFKSSDMFMRQFDAYASSHISAFDAFSRDGRGIHSGSVAAAFPYVYKVMMEKGGSAWEKAQGVRYSWTFLPEIRSGLTATWW